MRFWILHFGFWIAALPALGVWSPPTTNTYDWLNNVGIPGGIPIRTDVHSTLAAGSSLSSINSAVSGAASNKVVILQAGTTTLSGRINLDGKQGLTFRGETNANGYPTTVISSSASQVFGFDPAGFTYAGAAALSSGYTKGSTSVVFTATPNAQITPGNLMQIRADGIAGMHYTTGSGVADVLYWNVQVRTKSGTTVTFYPPLPYEVVSGQNPEALYLNGGPGARWCGIEDVVINMTGGSYGIELWGAYACWFKNVVISNTVDSGVFSYGSSALEVRHCFMTHASGTPNNSDGYGCNFRNGTSFSLIEDNIFQKMFCASYFVNGTGANALLFNFCTNMTAQGATVQIPAYRSNHGGCPMVNLWEGNVGEGFQGEAYHGSDSHATLFRNWFHGLSTTGTGNRIMVGPCRGAYWYAVAGNILGDDAWSGPGTFQLSMTGEPSTSGGASVIYRLGYPNTFNNGLDDVDDDPEWPDLPTGWPDTKVTNSIMLHGNYDYKTASVNNWPGEDTTLPNSLKYTSKPSYFGICPWPAFDPASPSSTNPTNIPAGYRFVLGVDPPSAAAVMGPPTRKQGLRGLKLKK